MRETLRPGLSHTLRYQVPENRTVPHLLPESNEFAALPPVLATGYLVGIVEWACMESVHGHLDDAETTLGIHVDLSHVAPTLPGATVRVDVTLADVTERTLAFTVQASDDNGTISAGTHHRGIIDRHRFHQRLARLRKAADR
ncbi:thioesterase family protein [Streptodolium elevatio]